MLPTHAAGIPDACAAKFPKTSALVKPAVLTLIGSPIVVCSVSVGGIVVAAAPAALTGVPGAVDAVS